jgi:translation initiation factor IF-2
MQLFHWFPRMTKRQLVVQGLRLYDALTFSHEEAVTIAGYFRRDNVVYEAIPASSDLSAIAPRKLVVSPLSSSSSPSSSSGGPGAPARAVVTVLGAAQSGKTSLVRRLASPQQEQDSIVQVRASVQVEACVLDGVTWMDTPGAALLSDMRATSGFFADIAVVTVSAELLLGMHAPEELEDMLSATMESLGIAQHYKTPLIVVITKMDVARVQGVGHEDLLALLEETTGITAQAEWPSVDPTSDDNTSSQPAESEAVELEELGDDELEFMTSMPARSLVQNYGEAWGYPNARVVMCEDVERGEEAVQRAVTTFIDSLHPTRLEQAAPRGAVLEAYAGMPGQQASLHVVLEEGVLNVGDAFVSGTSHGRVKAIKVDGQYVQAGFPGFVLEVTGMRKCPDRLLPATGDDFLVGDNNHVERLRDVRVWEHQFEKRDEIYEPPTEMVRVGYLTLPPPTSSTFHALPAPRKNIYQYLNGPSPSSAASLTHTPSASALLGNSRVADNTDADEDALALRENPDFLSRQHTQEEKMVPVEGSVVEYVFAHEAAARSEEKAKQGLPEPKRLGVVVKTRSSGAMRVILDAVARLDSEYCPADAQLIDVSAFGCGVIVDEDLQRAAFGNRTVYALNVPKLNPKLEATRAKLNVRINHYKAYEEFIADIEKEVQRVLAE